jgi:DNA polymerase-3 subunit epsilon
LLDFDFEPQRPAWSKQLAVFDLETTGLDLRESRIVTACLAVIDANGQQVQLHEWLVDPGIEIPEQAAAVHGVTTEMARARGTDPSAAVSELVELLGQYSKDMPLVAFNAPYDFTILQSEALRYAITPLKPEPVVDPLVLDRAMVKKRFGKRTLGVLCGDYGVELVDAHNSTADAIAAGRLAQRQAAKFPQLDVDAHELHRRQAIWSDEQSKEFEAWLKTQNRPDYQAELGWPIKIS